MGMNQAPVIAGIPHMHGNASDIPFGLNASSYTWTSGGASSKIAVHKTDPNAPSVFQVEGLPDATKLAKELGVSTTDIKQTGGKTFIKGPSRAELLLNQYAFVQSALKRMNVTTIDLHRGVNGSMVNNMIQDAKDSKSQGIGAKVLLHPASSWSASSGKASGFSGGEGLVFSKTVAIHHLIAHQDMKISSKYGGSDVKGIFAHYTDSEYECVVIGHASTTVGNIKKGETVRCAKLEDQPNEDPNIPKGFGIYRIMPSGKCYWITPELTQLCVFPDQDDYKQRRELNLSIEEVVAA